VPSDRDPALESTVEKLQGFGNAILPGFEACEREQSRYQLHGFVPLMVLMDPERPKSLGSRLLESRQSEIERCQLIQDRSKGYVVLAETVLEDLKG